MAANDNEHDDAGNDTTFLPANLPDDIEPMDVAYTVLSTASDTARTLAKAHPYTKSTSRVVVGLAFEADGSLALDDDGHPVILGLPVHYDMDDEKIAMTSVPNKMVSPKEAAEQLGVSVSTLKRARYEGKVAEPYQLSPRRVGWRQTDLLRIVAAGGLHEYVKAKKKAKAGK